MDLRWQQFLLELQDGDDLLGQSEFGLLADLPPDEAVPYMLMMALGELRGLRADLTPMMQRINSLEKATAAVGESIKGISENTRKVSEAAQRLVSDSSSMASQVHQIADDVNGIYARR